jgi:hypothetical protein
MRAFFFLTLATVVLIIFAALNLREVSLRELALYQGFYPINNHFRDLEPGDVLIVDLFENSLIVTGPKTCLSEFYSTRPYDYLKRQFTVSIGPSVVSGDQSLVSTERADNLVFDVTAVSPVDYISTVFSGDPSCEASLSELVGENCLLIVRNIISFDDVSVGFDTSERCQLINGSVDATVMNSLAAADFFDVPLGVSLIDRIWTSITLPLVQLQISD